MEYRSALVRECSLSQASPAHVLVDCILAILDGHEQAFKAMETEIGELKAQVATLKARVLE